MSKEDRQEVLSGYWPVPPPPKEHPHPRSGWGIYCQHLNEGCPEKLDLSRTTAEQTSHEDDYQHLLPAVYEAAVLLGWRHYKGTWWCPTHVVLKNLACARCRAVCPACSCMGGPRADAVVATGGGA